MRRRPLAILTLGLLGLIAISCGSGSSTATSSTSSSVLRTTTTTTKNSKAVSTTTTAAGFTARCTGGELSVSLGPADAGAGQISQPLILTNRGSRPCELKGFPGVSLLDHTATEIGAPASRSGAEGSTVRLDPGGAASALLRTRNAGGEPNACVGPSSEIRVFPPDSDKAIVAIQQYTACGGFSVTTLIAGVSGR